ISEAAMSGVPLTSAGLSGSEGSAATRSHSTRSADCACANAGAASTPIATVTPWKSFLMGRQVAMPSRQFQGSSPREVDAAIRHPAPLAGHVIQSLAGQNDDVGALAAAQAIQQRQGRREIGI